MDFYWLSSSHHFESFMVTTMTLLSATECLLSEDNVCVPFVVITIQFLPHSTVVTGIVKRVIRRLRHVEEKLLTLPEQ
jgi:hypothetical protein